MTLLPHYFSPIGPGAALAVVAEGQASHIECHGLADLEAEIEITPDTVFDLASGSKMFTAIGILLLIERAYLELTAPVYEFLPQFEHPEEGRPITVRDLLWHTSGLPDYLESGMHTPLEQMSSEFIGNQLHAWTRRACPGQSHSYSNTNYVVLAKVIEGIAGCSYSAFIESHLIDPLGLRDTFVSGGRRENNRIAKGYRNLGYGLPLFRTSNEVALDTVGDGGVFSSLRDLIEWQSSLWKGQIVNDALLKLMQAPGRLDSGETFDYGLGLQVEHRGGGNVWCGHGGSWTNSTILIGRHLREKTSVIVLSNEFMAPVERISQIALGMPKYPQRGSAAEPGDATAGVSRRS